jgi:hypothetical protein
MMWKCIRKISFCCILFVVLTNENGGVIGTRTNTILINSNHVSAQIDHYQAILKEYTSGNGIHTNYTASITFIIYMYSNTSCTFLRHQLRMTHLGRNVVSWLTKLFLWVTVTHIFLFSLERYLILNVSPQKQSQNARFTKFIVVRQTKNRPAIHKL